MEYDSLYRATGLTLLGLLTSALIVVIAHTNDQKRIATPHQAITDGADHIVVGRPVWQAKDPAAAARAITGELPPRQA